MSAIDQLDPKSYIIIKGARLHNLQNVDCAIPRNKLVVMTGLSGSGKSSLAFDTLFAEGQRRYVESLSSYARQFLGKLDKPKVDYIRGISPTVAIEQKVKTSNPRSTVGTSTEIYDYLRLLYTRIGVTYSPDTGEIIKKHINTDVIDYIQKQPLGEKLLLLCPVYKQEYRTIAQVLQILEQQGFARVWIDNKICRIDEVPEGFDEDFMLIVDRISVSEDEDFRNRLVDSIDTAFYEGHGSCSVMHHSTQKTQVFNNKFELDGQQYIEPTIHFFSFNNPLGACPKCEGYGDVLGIDPKLVIPNPQLSIYEGAISAWRGEKMKAYQQKLINNSHHFDFPIHTPWCDLSEEQQKLIWKGNKHFKGLDFFFKKLEADLYKIQNRVMLSRFRGRTSCDVCGGTKLRKETQNVKINNRSIGDLVDLPLYRLLDFFTDIQLNEYEHKISERILKEISSRLRFLMDVGLEYLTLNRKSNTLSGGESQRIRLATSLGSSLVGSIYVLDEPSIGLHPKDNFRLIKVLKSLRDLGNTVVVVEHDESIIREADVIIDIGPEAGVNGGKISAIGTLDEILKQDTLTAQYLNKKKTIAPREGQEKKKYKTFGVENVTVNNLHQVSASFPINALTVIVGVSGSGKSSFIKQGLYPVMNRMLEGASQKEGEPIITGDYESFSKIEYIDQNPISRSSRSNPVTYIKAYDDIRTLFAQQPLSKINGYTAKYFSFNVSDGGRCEECKGDGEVLIEMQFMADVHLTCDVCNGQRFKDEILEVKFQEKNITDILNMTIDDAIKFFDKHEQKMIANKLRPLGEVGMGYVNLGQTSSTLSGGEAQRIKLASFLVKGNSKEKILFIFDEPTTGLHFHDVKKLLAAFYALMDNGHTIIVVEHNTDLIRCANYVIEIGPEGGEKGGKIIATGTPTEIVANKNSVTGEYLSV